MSYVTVVVLIVFALILMNTLSVVLVCIPETSRIARNIVMSQGRKGMDNEAIDDFKGLVCFR